MILYCEITNQIVQKIFTQDEKGHTSAHTEKKQNTFLKPYTDLM